MLETVHCTHCGSVLVPKVIDQCHRLVCPQCGYIHYENPLPVVVAVVTRPGERLIGLIRRAIAPGKGKWALPGGFMEINETPQEAILREIREEIGLDGVVQGLVGVYSSRSSAYKGLVVMGFHVELGVDQASPGDEVSEFCFFPRSSHPPLVFPSHQQILLDYEKTYHNPFPTVDAIIHTAEGIVLVERKNPPHGWALPGGFVDYGESLEQSIRREVKEETNLEVVETTQFRTYSDPNRDPRWHTISTVFLAKTKGVLKAGDDAKKAIVFSVHHLPEPIAFDHHTVITDYLRSTGNLVCPE